MKIRHIESFLLRIPFNPGGKTTDWSDWTTLDSVLIRVDTDNGISGWGDAFGYGAAHATKAAVDHMIAPALIGQDAGDIAGIARSLQHGNHLWGRYGVTMFAIGGIDIALWDIAGKAAGLPLCRLFGGAVRDRLPAYASLFKYQDEEAVAERTAAALAEGYGYVKLHETGEAEVRAAREAAGDGVPIMVDTNCPWTAEQAARMAERLLEYDPHWLEEPIFPPEDFEALADLQLSCGIPIAAGENACTAFEFKRMFEAGAVTYAQPSVTKVGGISEFRKVAALAEAYNVTLMPHAPYFGPGFLATLHLMAPLREGSLVERLYVMPEATFYGPLTEATQGSFRVPDGPGLGADPDPDVLKDYLVKNA